MKILLRLFLLSILLPLNPSYAADEGIRIAAAADLKYALTEIAGAFRAAHPKAKVDLVFGSSGKFHAQIENGGPFDLFFSADIEYPRKLRAKGLASTEPRLYAIGRIALWSPDPELAQLPLRSLPNEAAIRRFAIANPLHAPYGRRAQEALKHEGVWEAMQSKLVLGDNIAHTAQFVDSGAAQAGIVALSLVLGPTMKERGSYTVIPAEWHQPLEQAYVVTSRARNNPLAVEFAKYVETPEARSIMRRYGFTLPNE